MDLHGQIMNLTAARKQHDLYANTSVAYLCGDRDARHAAAELASVDEAARVAPLRARLEWLENALQHIVGSCDGRAAEIAAAALAWRELVSG